MTAAPKKDFNRAGGPAKKKTAEELQKSSFSDYLEYLFGKKSASKIIDTFRKLDLPPPVNNTEYLAGADGGLVFLNQYGLVIRIEHASADASIHQWDRVGQSGWVLQPLVEIDAGRAVIEICPGCNLETEQDNLDMLHDRLREQQIDFWDKWLVNAGRIPVETALFPEGVPVVIDRLAVSRLSAAVGEVAEDVEAAHRAALNVQQLLYGPLRAALEAAWPGQQGEPRPRKMKSFWSLCASYAENGSLVAGWNQAERGSYYKTDIVMDVAETYEKRLLREGKPVRRRGMTGKAQAAFKTRQSVSRAVSSAKAASKKGPRP